MKKIILGWLKIYKEVGIVLTFTLMQCVWTSLLTSLKVGLLNLLPTLLFLTIWYLFIKVETKPKVFWYYFSLGWLLTLRLPLTIARVLEPLSWILYLSVAGLVLYKIVHYFKLKRQLMLLLVTIIIILFNSFAHISLNSPYTYSFRVTNNLKSTYTSNVDNNLTWECPYESPKFMVSCDMRHSIAVEKMFTESKYDPSFSVYLLRFFYGYLSSLIGFDGHRWIASFNLNLLFWLFACTALYKTCILTKLSERVAAIAMLCCASSWGFISFVGQPAMYLAAYAYASITIWATIEIIYCNSIRKNILLSLLIVSGSLVYDIYPLILACLIVLFTYKEKVIATLILVLQLLLTSLWSKFSLEQVLGSIGDQTSSGNVHDLKHSFNAWMDLVTKLDFTQAIEFISKGTQSYVYGGMILGTAASCIFLFYLLIANIVEDSKEGNKMLPLLSSPIPIYLLIDSKIKSAEKSDRLLLILSFLVCFLILLSTIFVNPASHHWSPNSGMMPRLAFYTYPINMIALATITEGMFRKKAFVVVLFTFLISNLDLLTGSASVSQLFDYGLVGIYWK